MDPITRALSPLTVQSSSEETQDLQSLRLKSKKEDPQVLTIEDLADNCLMRIMWFSKQPGILNQVSRRWYRLQALEQLVSHPTPSYDPEARYASIPHVKLNLVAQMALFAPNAAAMISDLNSLACSLATSSAPPAFKEEAMANFAEFESKYPAEAAMLCSFSILHSFVASVNIENLYLSSQQELASFLSKFWNEKIANNEQLRLRPKSARALSEKIVRMPNLKRLIISGSEPTLDSAYLMINPSFLPPTHINPLHEEEITSFPFIRQLRSLQSLEISSVSHLQLPDDLSDLHQLSVVSLTHNHLTHVPRSPLTLPNLQHLNLQNNDFRALPYELTLLPQRTFVDLRQNSIQTRIPERFKPMIRESRLVLDGTDYDTIREARASSTPLQGRQRPRGRLF